MNNLSNHNPEFINHNGDDRNLLWEYLQSLNPEALANMSKPSPSAAQVMERNVRGMLGVLPPEHFQMEITTTAENLSRLLASAMMSGYFLHNAEQRLALEESVAGGSDESEG
ncbi:DUF760 domain-containing protein [Phormidium sp. CCY1219]|jgi:hypothetical protein|uniref:DUF760 domain-containing protein n=1 Tax=Phormidium sp. CCY1219 TaxID=2886104 RepID=UPI002D1E58F2|nr:DUF760 domain-containing protein [Phormidium sp. CCY1219]MEB3827338.1 DUF760 domain-containing protein [Phormidium sp. CCY1219]